MTCLWDRNWTFINDLDPCDWVQCLKQPEPPAISNLRKTYWDGNPINFGDKITYVCEKGFQFEDDQNQVSINYQCQDGTKPGTKRGFFNTPTSDDEWPRCTEGSNLFKFYHSSKDTSFLSAPVCPEPPPPPFEGLVVNVPIVYPIIQHESCNVDGSLVNMICPSFLTIYIRSGYYGRVKGSSLLCTGQKDSVTLMDDCLTMEVKFYSNVCL